MAKGFNIEVSDKAFNNILKKYKGKIDAVALEMDMELAAHGVMMERSAKNKVPVDTGLLKGSISLKKEQFLSYQLVAQKKYAAYVEFGTGDFGFGIPVYPNVNMGELEAYALTFKRNKKTIGMPYRPFMFNSYSEVLSKMVNKIKKIRI